MSAIPGNRAARGCASSRSTRCGIARRRLPEGGPPPPHRAPLRGRAREPRRRSTPTRARSPRQQQRGDAPEPRAALRWWSTAGRTSRSSTTRSSTSSRRTPRGASSSWGSASRRSTRVQLEDVDSAIGRYRRVMEVDPENQSAVRFARSPVLRRPSAGRELATILEREAEIGQRPDEILEFEFRLGQVQQVTLEQRRRGDQRPTATCSARRPSTRTRRSRPRRPLRDGIKQLEIGEILEPLYRAASEWEKLVARARSASSRTPRTDEQRGAPRGVLPHRGAPRDKRRWIRWRTLDVYMRALKEFPLDETHRRGVDRASPARWTAAGRPLANAYADILGLHRTRPLQGTIGRRSREDVFEDELGDVDEGGRDVPLRPLGRGARSARRSRTSIASTSRSSRGPSSRASSSMRVRAGRRPARARSSSTRGSARSTRRGSGHPERDARLPARSSTSSLKTHDGGHPRARAHLLGARRELGRAQRRLRARARERVGRRGRGRDPREARRTSRPTASARRRGRDRHLEDRARSARRGSGGAQALSNLYEQQQQWRELIDILERQLRHRGERRRAREHPHAKRAHVRRSSSSATTWRSRTGSASSTSTTRTSPRCAPIARDPASQQRSPGARHGALHAVGGSRRGAARRRRSSRRSSASSAGSTAACSSSRSRPPTPGATCSRSTPTTSRRWTPSREIYRGQEQWTDVIGVKMQRAAALDRSRREDPGVPSGHRDLARDGPGDRQGDSSLAEGPRDRSDARGGVRRSSSACTRRREAVGAADRALTSDRLESRRRPCRSRTDLLRRIARVFEENLGDKNQAFDALVNALRRGLPRSTRRLRVPRAHGPGAPAAGASSSTRRTPGSRSRRSPEAQKITPLPAGSASGTATISVTPSTRSLTTRRSSRSTRTTFRLMRQMGQHPSPGR